jgi:glyoxylase-like metal-dependent hydrolase (beta-lactamase superfamily II)
LEYLSITENVGVLPLRTNVGFVRCGTDCVVIDTGIDEDAGKRILKTATTLGLRIKAIVNTHSHSDHYGGNAFLVQRTGGEVLAPAGESWVLEQPWLEAAYLSQGAVPLPQLINRFVLGPASKVDRTITEGAFSAGGLTLEAVSLPGHSFAMTGIGAGGVLFCGDALFGAETIRKHGVLFLHDPDRTRASLLRLETLLYEWFVPSHGPPCPKNELPSLVRENISAIDSFDDIILRVLDGPMSMSRLTSRALVAAGLHLGDPSRIILMHSTVMAHISCLSRRGRISVAAGTEGTDLEDDLVCSPS